MIVEKMACRKERQGKISPHLMIAKNFDERASRHSFKTLPPAP